MPMSTVTTFKPAASVTAAVIPGSGAAISLPAVDGSNLDMTVTNTSPQEMVIVFQNTAAPYSPSQSQVIVDASATVLVPAIAGAATFAAVLLQLIAGNTVPGSTVTFTRGTASPLMLFTNVTQII